jgi:hypothetical protein
MRAIITALALTSCTPQVEVATASQLNCEDELHRMFETREQCRALRGLEEAFGKELAGGNGK